MVNCYSSFLLTTVLIFITLSVLKPSSATASDYEKLNWVPQTAAVCQGSMAECMVDEAAEFEMDSEINRRMLATTNYISYDSLKRDSTPCSKKGASYYNCQTGTEANPYNRGCSAITRCRS